YAEELCELLSCGSKQTTSGTDTLQLMNNNYRVCQRTETCKASRKRQSLPIIIWMTFNSHLKTRWVCRSLSTVLIIEHIQNNNNHNHNHSRAHPAREMVMVMVMVTECHPKHCSAWWHV